MDTNQTLAAAAAASAYALKDLVAKVLGPTAERIGGDLAWQYDNLVRVLKIARKKLGDKVEKDGGVHPRVARKTSREASDFDDRFAAEYFGGILASARSNNSDDDLAIQFLNKLEQLCAKEVRLHFVAHYLFLQLVKNLPYNCQTRYWISYGVRLSASQLCDFLCVNDPNELNCLVRSLVRHELLGEKYGIKHDEICDGYGAIEVDQDRVFLTFTNEGLGLFMKALGLRGLAPDILPAMDIDKSLSDDLPLAETLPILEGLFRICDKSKLDELVDEIQDFKLELELKIENTETELEATKAELSSLKEELRDP